MTRDGTTRRRLLGALGAAGTAGAAAAGGAGPAVASRGDTDHALAAADATQGGSWPLFQYDAANTGHNPRDVGPAAAVGTQWRAAIDRVETPPILADGTAYVADPGAGAVHAFDRASGDQRWTTDLDVTSSRMALAGDTLYVPGDQLYALDAASGTQRWAAGDGSYYAVTIKSGFAYVAGASGVESIDVNNRSTLWDLQGEPIVDSAHAVGQDRIFAVETDDGKVRAVDPGGGNTRWERLLGTTPQGEPVAAGGKILVPAESELIALDAVTGSVAWRQSTPVRGSVAVADGAVYGNDANGGQVALDLETGQATWRGGPVTSTNSPVVAGGTLYVVGDGGTVAALQPTDGAVVWQRSLDASFTSAPAVAGGELVVAGSDAVHALSPDVATPTATPTETATATPTDTVTATATASPTPTPQPEADEESDGGSGGLLLAAAVALALLLGGGGAVAVLGVDAIREALGLAADEGTPGDEGPPGEGRD